MYTETIKCMICGKETTQINHAHLKKHGVTSKEYKEMFPGAKMRVLSEKQKQLAREAFTNMNRSESFRNHISKQLSGKPKSEEHKQALKEAKAREDKELRAKINGNNRRGKKHSRETIEHIARHSLPCNFKSGIRKDLGHFVRSSWEANFARVLKYTGVEYQFEPQIFWLKLPDGSETTYTPDFYLPKEDKYIEVKGFWYEDAKLKYELFRVQYPHIKIDVVDQEKYRTYENKFKSQIGEWE